MKHLLGRWFVTSPSLKAWSVQVAAAVIVLCLLLLSLSLSALTRHVGASSITLFSDTFESDPLGSFPANWTHLSGAWSVQEDGSHVLEQVAPTITTEKEVSAGSTSWTDYVLQVDVKPGFTKLNGVTELMARFTDPDNYYSLLLSNINRWSLGKKVSGVWTLLAQGTYTPISRFYSAALSVQGTTISASLNGTTLASQTDASLMSGMIAFGTNVMSKFDNVSVTANSSSPTPTPAASPTPSPGAGNAQLTLTPSGSSLMVKSLDTNNNGWQVLLNQPLGGAITSTQEIDNGVLTELQDQSVLHSLVQCYVQVGGSFVSNQQQAGQIIVLRNSPELIGIETISSNTTDHLTWTFFYYFWPDGQVYIAFSLQNTGSTPLKLTTPDSVQINIDGLLVPGYSDSSPQAWYGLGGTVASPIPGTVSAKEADFFARTPTVSAPPSTGFFIDKFTSWAAAGASNYGIMDYTNGHRGKDQWLGNLPTFAAGQVLPFSLLLEFRRNMTQSQSLSIDSDYRTPSMSVSTGVLETTDNEPVPQTLNNGFNMDVGAYVIGAASNQVNAQLNLPAGVTTRWTARFKIVGWSKGAPTVTWGGLPLTAGVDYSYTLDSSANVLYVQLDFDVVTGSPGPGQQANAPFDIS